ncbi:MAG: hypothetical protein SGI86_02145 [Deltaproteobacteria bacterium]|nr:hypothetical protein [Deltaproteobacteria bacterium]
MKQATVRKPVRKPLLLRGQVDAINGLLSSPASGQSCVFWQLRIVETVSPTLDFIHELRSPESFLFGDQDTVGNERQILIRSESAFVSSETTHHRSGSPEANAVAEALGIAGKVTVEEHVLRPSVWVEASGYLLEGDTGAGPSRRVHLPLELWEAEVRVTTEHRRFTFLPWRWR